MSIDQHEALAMIAELQRMHDEVRSLLDGSDGQSDILKRRLTALKQDIKEAAKYETISRKKIPKTELEQAFFGPAIRSTSANFRMRTDTNPGSPAWARGLYEVELELSYHLHGLESYLSKERK